MTAEYIAVMRESWSMSIRAEVIGLVVMTVVGCSDASLPPDAALDATATSDSSMDDAGSDAALDGGPRPDAPTSEGGRDGSIPDAGPGCSVPADCTAALGAPPCSAAGEWQCSDGQCDVLCPGCTDADLDGHGPNAACAGPDCDDADDAVTDSSIRSCYSGPSGTDGMGTCRAGTQTCTAGVIGRCVGEVGPSGEACNLEDDDCDGSIDEELTRTECGIGACFSSAAACADGLPGACTPGAPAAMDASCNSTDDDCDGAVDEDCPTCVRVATTGNDANAIADDNATPFRTIQGAITWAAAGPSGSRPRRVCVAAGATCGTTATFTGAVTMSNGISVYADFERTTWTRCDDAVAPTTTIIAPAGPLGVLFPDTVTSVSRTELVGFHIQRAVSGIGMSSTGVTVDGAVAMLADLTVLAPTGVPRIAIGVNVINGGNAVVTRSSIDSGGGMLESTGVRSEGSRVTVRDNCGSFAGGRCTALNCDPMLPAIRGRQMGTVGDSSIVRLSSSPGSIVERNALCGGAGANGAGISVSGDATGTVIRGNLINAFGGLTETHGIVLADCGGAEPWVFDNSWISATSPSGRGDVIHAVGDCHPVIESNAYIAGGSILGGGATSAIFCGEAGGVASRCLIVGNADIRGASDPSLIPALPSSVGIRCESGGCMRIANNSIDGRGGTMRTRAISLDEAGPLIDGNTISGGCGSVESFGIVASDSYATIQNNYAFGSTCNTAAGTVTGVLVEAPDVRNEVELHSNTIVGRTVAATCSGTGLALATGSTPSGVYRNNVISAGLCDTSVVVSEAGADSDPLIFESNDLDPAHGSPSALYLDEGSTPLTTAAMVNALTDATVSGNLSVDPGYASFPMDLHLMAGSMCIDAGTAVGAPGHDFDGDVRDASPDIGADEL
jgi:hypothetical protein